jgi:hypothetical protein
LGGGLGWGRDRGESGPRVRRPLRKEVQLRRAAAREPRPPTPPPLLSQFSATTLHA